MKEVDSMENKQINIGKKIEISIDKHYKRFGQMIIGTTINVEKEQFASSSLYDDIAFERSKIEFNIWIFLISFHLTIYGKMKNYSIS